MTSALQNRAVTDPVSDEELEEFRNLFIEEEATKLLKTDMLSVFMELEDPEPMLTSLYSCSLPDLIRLQLSFHETLRHQARLMAMRKWEHERAFTIRAIQDGRVE